MAYASCSFDTRTTLSNLSKIRKRDLYPKLSLVSKIRSRFMAYSRLGFTVRNLDHVFADLKQRGVKVEFNTTQLDDLRLRAFGILDMDGNLIQFFGK
jgi:hypothetical protein